MSVVSTKQTDITREWHVIDVADKVIGRESTQIANLLRGKSKSYFVPHLDCGDHVVVINAKRVKATGNKETQKIYRSYSGFPSGLKEITLEKLRETKPEEIIRHAVSGMLPKNKLRDRWLTRLHVYAGSDHPHSNVSHHGKN